MQIFFPGGIIMPALRPANTVPEGDPRLIQVRARRISHLRRLKERYLPELGDIIEIPHTDYEYRAYCTHEQLAAALAALAMDIDYVKSKDQAIKQYHDDELYRANNAVWGTLYRSLSTHKVFSRPARGSFKPPVARKSSGAHRQLNWYDDIPSVDDELRTLGQLVGTAQSTDRDDERALVDAVPASWDAELAEAERDAEQIARHADGSIDHSECSHGSGRNARRRCQRRNAPKRR